MKKLPWVVLTLLVLPLVVYADTFTRPLTIGATGSDVTALQQLLVAQGLLNTSPTGFFGPLTAAALSKLQSAHGLEAVGSVGPHTRTLLNSLSSGSTASTQPSSPTSCTGTLTLTRALDVGMSGSDITQLQTFLVAQGLLNTTPTGYYGVLTSAAVKQLQSKNNLEAIGGVGPKTRALIASLSGQCTATTQPASGSGVVLGTSTPVIIQNYTPPAVGGGGGSSGGSTSSSGGGGGGGGGSSGGGGGSVSVDTQTPTIPANLVATAVSSVEIDVSWSAATDNVGVTTYLLTRNGVPIATQSGTTYQDGGLSPNTQYTYTVAAADAAGNVSAASASVVTMTQAAVVLDTTPPVLTLLTPTGTLISGTTQTTLGVTTDEAATCKYATASTTSYAAMTPYSATGGTTHTSTLSSLTNGSSYTYFVKCADAANNISPNGLISFNVATPASPVVTFSASPTTVVSGNASTLTWTSTNATACTASGAWSGSQALNGSLSVSPASSATYTLTCTGSGGSANQSATVTVTPAPDTTPPSTPTNLMATAASSTAITLNWTASTDNVGVTGYRVFRNGTQVGTPATNAYTDTALTASTQYTYTVKAIDAAGNLSSASTAATATTQAPPDTTPPSVTITAPTANLPANTTSTSLSVTTNEAATCRYSTTSTFTFSTGTLFTTTGNTSHTSTLSGLQNSTTYTYYVKCQDTAGNTSGNASVTFSVLTPPDTTAPSTPTGLSATAQSSSAINLSWSASTDNVGVSGYQVFRNLAQIATSTGTTYGDLGLAASTLYSYLVKAFDAAGNVSAASAAATATTGAGGGGSDPTTGVLPSYDDANANWKNAGMVLVGGIPNKTTICATLTPLGGTNDDFTQIQNAITNCAVGSVVQLNAGTFNVHVADIPIRIPKGIVLRGSGTCTGSTSPYCQSSIVVSDGALAYTGDKCGTDTAHEVSCPNGGSAVIEMMPQAPDYNFSWAQCGNTGSNVGSTACGAVALTADAAQGDTTIHVADTSKFTVGSWVRIDELSAAGWVANPNPTSGYGQIWATPEFLNPSGNPTVARFAWSKAQNGGWDFGASTDLTAANTPGCWHSYCDRVTTELHKVSAIGAGTITFDDPLTIGFRASGGHNAQVYPNFYINQSGTGSAASMLQNAGVENLSVLRGTNGGITMSLCVNCWIKNTEVGYWYGGGIDINNSARSELNNVYVHHAADSVNNGGEYPIALDDASTEILVTNSITNFAGKGMVARAGGSGSVVSYTYIDDTMYDNNSGIGDYWVDMALGGSHWTGQHHILFEGNWADNLDVDHTHGSGAYQTYFRNLGSGLRTPFTDPSNNKAVNDFTGVGNCGTGCTSAPGPLRAAGPSAYNYWFGFVGNVLGTAGKTTAANGWTYQGDWNGKRMWMIGWNEGNGGQDSHLTGSASSYIFRNDNFDYITNGIADAASGYSQSLPNSFYLSSTPSFFGTNGSCTYPWPWVTPNGSSQLQTNTCGGSGLPAKARWDSGTPLAQAGGAAPSDTQAPTTPTNLSAPTIATTQVSLSWTASTDNTAVTGYNIYRGGVQVGSSATNAYTDTGLTASTSYTYTVAAYDAAGNVSTQSTSITVRTAGTQQSGGGGSSTETFVQTIKTLNNNHGTSITSGTITVTAGDLLVVTAAFWSQNPKPPTVTSITLDGATTFTIDKTQVLTANNEQSVVIASLPNVAAGAHTVTVNTAGAVSIGSTVFVSEFSGPAATADTSASIDGFGITPSPGTFSSVSSNDLWVAVYSANVDQTSSTAASGWTMPANGINLTNQNVGYPISGMEYMIASGVTSGTPSWTNSGNANWAAAGVAYK